MSGDRTRDFGGDRGGGFTLSVESGVLFPFLLRVLPDRARMVRQGRLGVRGAVHGAGEGGTEDCLRRRPRGAVATSSIPVTGLQRVAAQACNRSTPRSGPSRPFESSR